LGWEDQTVAALIVRRPGKVTTERIWLGALKIIVFPGEAQCNGSVDRLTSLGHE
jgi:hypothetical protein